MMSLFQAPFAAGERWLSVVRNLPLAISANQLRELGVIGEATRLPRTMDTQTLGEA
jgi:hypothetical protein